MTWPVYLKEAAAWCERTLCIEDLGTSSRTEEMRPSFLPHGDPQDGFVGAFERETIANAVEEVCSKRSQLIRKRQLELPWWYDIPCWYEYCHVHGRLYCTDFNTDMCEAATAESNGFFDLADIPGWDTWVAYDSKSALLYGWVPNSVVAPVGRGIWVIPTQCVRWVSNIPESAK